MSQPVVLTSNPPTAAVPAATPTPAPTSQKKGMLWAVLTSIFLMWVFFYVCFQVFNPVLVQQGDAYRGPDAACERRPPDNGKCFVASLIVTVILMLIIWLIIASMK